MRKYEYARVAATRTRDGDYIFPDGSMKPFIITSVIGPVSDEVARQEFSTYIDLLNALGIEGWRPRREEWAGNFNVSYDIYRKVD